MSITRTVVDLVHDDELTEHQMTVIAKATSDFQLAVAIADVEVEFDHEDRFFHAHKHHSTEDRACAWCRSYASDERN